MESFLIKGGVPLHGEVTISGSKNAALPIMAAALLTGEPCIIRGVPDLSDTRFMAQILASLGATVKFECGTLTVRAQKSAVMPITNSSARCAARFASWGRCWAA